MSNDVKIGVTLIAALIFVMNSEFLLSRENIYLKVIENNAVSECRWSRKSLIHGRKFRNQSPEVKAFSYCGLIRTDRGAYKLIQSQRFHLFTTDRNSLDEILQDGCEFQVGIYGFGKTPKFGAPLQNRRNKTIYSVTKVLGCED